MWIAANNEKLQYTGRIDWSNETEPVFVFPCTSVEMCFTGSLLRVHVRNRNVYWENYLGCILDGVQSCYYLKNKEETVIDVLVPENETNMHQVMFFKRQDSCHEMAILGFEIGEGENVCTLPKKSERRLEIYGDSVSAGEVSEAIDYVGKEDPMHRGGYSNSWYSYAWMTARKLGAQIHDIAQGGIALRNQTGWFCEPDQIGMEDVWNTIHYQPALGDKMLWDFAKYVPQVVIVAVGQNDSHPTDYMKSEYYGKQSVVWRERYQQFLSNLRQTYPNAEIICCTTLLQHDAAWDQAIGEVVASMQDDKITQYLFRRNGKATPGHLRIPEAEEMAQELADYINGRKVKW